VLLVDLQFRGDPQHGQPGRVFARHARRDALGGDAGAGQIEHPHAGELGALGERTHVPVAEPPVVREGQFAHRRQRF